MKGEIETVPNWVWYKLKSRIKSFPGERVIFVSTPQGYGGFREIYEGGMMARPKGSKNKKPTGVLITPRISQEAFEKLKKYSTEGKGSYGKIITELLMRG